MSRIVIVGCALVLNVVCSTLFASERLPSLSFAMDEDPKLGAPAVQYGLPSDWKTLWQEALTAQEEDLRREAATALMRLRQQDASNIDEMNNSMLKGFNTTTDRVVRLSIATALIQFDVREAAADLYEFSSSGNLTVANRIEPALAKWDFEPIQAEWLHRIQEPAGVTVTQLVLAIQGVALSGIESAVPGLLALATNEGNSDQVRTAAATAAGTLQDNGLADVCRALAADESEHGFVNRFVAARILARHTDESSQELLLKLSQDSSSAVAAIAIERMLELDSAAIYKIHPELLGNADARVRQFAAQSLVANSSPDAVKKLCELLNDRHPDVRSFVRESLEAMANDESLRDLVEQHATRIIDGDDWRGQEQVARLFGTIGYEASAESLVELLNHRRTEVFVTAGWALRELAVPETLPAMLGFVQERTKRKITPADNVCFAYLFESFGLAEYSSAAPILRSFIPDGSGRQPVARAAAIWALGHIHKDDPPDDLVRQFSSRLSAAAGYPPSEVAEVGIAAAVSLGRMNVLRPLESAAAIHGRGDLLYEACQWAMAHISGSEQPVTPTIRVSPKNPFLRPIER
jgi:HEAT repeat protein